MEIMPEFIFDGVEQIFIDSANRLRDFIQTHYRVPKYVGTFSGEKDTYSFMQRVRHAYQTSDTSYLTPNRLKYI